MFELPSTSKTQLIIMLNPPEKPFIYYWKPVPPPLLSESTAPQVPSSTKKSLVLAPLLPLPSKKDSLLDLGWEPPLGSHLNPDMYSKALEGVFRILVGSLLKP